MGTQLRQLNVTYVDVQDRLLLKVSTSEDQEYRAWCTRRFTRLLLERLELLFEKEVAVEPAVSHEARKDVAKLKHSASVSEEAFQLPYEAEPVSYPLGEEGSLLTRISYNRTPAGILALNLSGEDGKGLTLNLDNKLQHHFYEMLSRAAERAEWFEQSADSGNQVVH